VYHYTKFSTALLIIRSATLRATRFNLLNDTQEIDYAKGVIAKKLAEKFPKISPEQAKYTLDIFRKPFWNAFYLTSFCGKSPNTNPYHRDNGLLSMWRHYGADGGCAISFNTQNIFKKTSSSWISSR